MRIVSQNRNYSFEFGHIVIWTQSEYIYAKMGNESIVIGQYESSERAAEVFDDIHKAYSPYGLICSDLSDEQIQAFVRSKNLGMPVIKLDNIQCSITTYDSVVYYMPKE